MDMDTVVVNGEWIYHHLSPHMQVNTTTLMLQIHMQLIHTPHTEQMLDMDPTMVISGNFYGGRNDLSWMRFIAPFKRANFLNNQSYVKNC